MREDKIELLKTYLSLYVSHATVLENAEKYVLLDVRNAPAQIKKDQIKGAIAMPAKDLETRLNELDKSKTYVVYDWTAGTTLGKEALLILLTNGFDAYELSSAMEGWKGMNLPIEALV